MSDGNSAFADPDLALEPSASTDSGRHRRGETEGALPVALLLAKFANSRVSDPTAFSTEMSDAATVRFAPISGLADAPTQLLAPVGAQSEVHVSELLKREGRADSKWLKVAPGGMSVRQLLAVAGGGVALCGVVAWGASSLLSPPEAAPVAEVSYDSRAAARAPQLLPPGAGEQSTTDQSAASPNSNPQSATSSSQLRPAEAANRPQAGNPTTSRADSGPNINPPSEATTAPRTTSAAAPSSTGSTSSAPKTTQPTTTQPTTTTTPTTTSKTPSSSRPGNTTPPSTQPSTTTASNPSSTPTSETTSAQPRTSPTSALPGLGLDLDKLLGNVADGFDFFSSDD